MLGRPPETGLFFSVCLIAFKRCCWRRWHQPGDIQFLTADPSLFQVGKNGFGHADGKLNQGMIVLYVDTTDVPSVQPCLVGDRANDIPRLHFMVVSDFDTKSSMSAAGASALRLLCRLADSRSRRPRSGRSDRGRRGLGSLDLRVLSVSRWLRSLRARVSGFTNKERSPSDRVASAAAISRGAKSDSLWYCSKIPRMKAKSP